MSQHTPGPWDTFTYDKRIVMHGNDLLVMGGGYVAEIHTDPQGNRDREQANSRLIAAAPDLLAALKTLVPITEAVAINYRQAHMFDWDNIAQGILAAIAKAEGAS